MLLSEDAFDAVPVPPAALYRGVTTDLPDRWTPVVCTGGPPKLAAKPPRKSVKPLRAVMLVRAFRAPGLASNWASGMALARAAGVVAALPTDALLAVELLLEVEVRLELDWVSDWWCGCGGECCCGCCCWVEDADCRESPPPAPLGRLTDRPDPDRPGAPPFNAPEPLLVAVVADAELIDEVDEDEDWLLPSDRFAFWSSTLLGYKRE